METTVSLHQVAGDLGVVKTSSEVLIPTATPAAQNGTAGYGQKIWRGIVSEQQKAENVYKPIFAEIAADPMREATAKRAESELRAELAQYKVDVHAAYGLINPEGGISPDKGNPATELAKRDCVARSNRVSRLCLGIRVAGLGRYDEVAELGFDPMLNACRLILAENAGRLAKDGTIKGKRGKGNASEATESVDVNKSAEFMAALEALVTAGVKSEDALVREISEATLKLVQGALAAEVKAEMLKAA